jgi:hypothetical protein
MNRWVSISLGLALLSVPVLALVLEKLYGVRMGKIEIGVISDLVWRKLVVVFVSV